MPFPPKPAAQTTLPSLLKLPATAIFPFPTPSTSTLFLLSSSNQFRLSRLSLSGLTRQSTRQASLLFLEKPAVKAAFSTAVRGSRLSCSALTSLLSCSALSRTSLLNPVISAPDTEIFPKLIHIFTFPALPLLLSFSALIPKTYPQPVQSLSPLTIPLTLTQPGYIYIFFFFFCFFSFSF